MKINYVKIFVELEMRAATTHALFSLMTDLNNILIIQKSLNKFTENKSIFGF